SEAAVWRAIDLQPLLACVQIGPRIHADTVSGTCLLVIAQTGGRITGGTVVIADPRPVTTEALPLGHRGAAGMQQRQQDNHHEFACTHGTSPVGHPGPTVVESCRRRMARRLVCARMRIGPEDVRRTVPDPDMSKGRSAVSLNPVNEPE